MPEPSLPQPGRPTGAPRLRRHRWHVVYYLLAGFNIFAVSVGLYLNHRTSVIYGHSLAADQWWARQFSDYWDLERHARAVNVAASEVFASRDVAGEVQKMHRALALLRQDIGRERAELRATIPSGDVETLLRDLDAVDAAVAALVAEASWLFAQFESDRPQEVTTRLGAIERHYAAVDGELARLRQHAAQIQRRLFAEQAAIATSLSRVEHLIAALVLAMVAAATVYGRKLAQQAQLAEAELEARVRERTAALDGANQTLSAEIVQREHAEQDLRDSEARYRTLFESNPQPLWVYDRETLRFLAVSDAAVRHYGYSREEFRAMSLENIRPAEDIEALREDVARAEAGPTKAHVWRHRKKDGTLIDVEIVAHGLAFGGRAARLVLATDVTERRVLEERLRQSQKMEAIGRLAGGVAHDFNNILGIIMGYGSILKRSQPPKSPSHRQIDQILKATDRAADLTRQLLAFSRKQVLQPRILDLNSVVADTDKMLRRLIGEDVRLVTSMAPALGRVSVDPGQIGQVLMNLAVNARDAMPKGGTLTVETANVVLDENCSARHVGVQAGAYVMLAVSDTGAGMDAAMQTHIFEPFFTTKGPGKGTGLGLSTVHGIVEQSGGHIGVDSEPGCGTTFKIYLPRVAGQEAQEAPPEPDRALFQGSETILLVEDEEPLRAMIRETLEDSGYCVIEAPTPAEALSIASSRLGRIDLMLTDVVMPEMSGPELGRRLGGPRPDTRVLYMSGYTDERIGHHGVLEAGTHFIQKPFAASTLLRRLREVLDKG